MDTLNRAYRKAVRSELHPYQENWQPMRDIDVGSIFSVKGGEIVIRSSLQKEGILIKKARTKSDSLLFTFGKGTEYEIEADASVAGHPVTASGKIKLKFDQKNGVFVCAAGCVSETLANRKAVFAEIKDRATRGAWNYDWSFVDEIVLAKNLNVVISTAGGAELELAGQAESPTFDLADASVSLSVKRLKGGLYQCIGAKDAVPCFKAHCLKKNLLSKKSEISVKTHKLGQHDEEQDEDLEEDLNDFSFEQFGLD